MSAYSRFVEKNPQPEKPPNGDWNIYKYESNLANVFQPPSPKKAKATTKKGRSNKEMKLKFYFESKEILQSSLNNFLFALLEKKKQKKKSQFHADLELGHLHNY